MKKRNKFYECLVLFYTFAKIGLFTFGGGYAMIPIIQNEVSEKRKWVKPSEILDVLAISESTPGPISINAATYIGYRVCGFWGALSATIGLVLPSFLIIFAISFFYKTFMSWKVVSAAFKGIKVGVIILLVNAVFKLKKAVPSNWISALIFIVTLIAVLAVNIFSVNIPAFSIILIVAGLLVGIVITILSKKGETKK